MANTLNGVNLGLIAQESLPPLQKALFLIRNLFNDFTDQFNEPGQSVTTRVPTLNTASDFSNGITVSNAVTTAFTITLGAPQGVSYKFSPSQVAQSKVDLLKLFAEPAMYAIAKKITDDALALLTNANYPNPVVNAVANFDGDIVATLAQKLTEADVPQEDRFLLLSPAAYTSLAQDDGIKFAYAYGSNSVITDNRIPKVHGFSVIEYNGIPDPDGKSLYGIAGHKNGLLVASRMLPEIQDWSGRTEYVADPESGMTVQMSYFGDGIQQGNYLAAQALYGVQTGVTQNIIRLTGTA